MILRMVADQKISATEAAELLKALGDTDQEGVDRAEPTPPTPPSPPVSPSTRLFSLGSLLEGVVDKVTSALAEIADPPYEFPLEFTGEFGAGEVPLHIQTGNGRVEIQSWNEPGYRATLLVKESGANEAEARSRAESAFALTAGENGFHLETRHRGAPSERAVHVLLMVPQDRLYRLDTKTGNGRIHLENLAFTEGSITTGNGKISIEGGTADKLSCRSGNGAIEIESDIAALEAESGNGTVKVRPVSSRACSLHLSTGNGAVRVDTNRLAPGAGFQVEIHTGMGGVSLNLPNMLYEREIRFVAHKHIIAKSADFEHAAFPVTISARIGMGSITIE